MAPSSSGMTSPSETADEMSTEDTATILEMLMLFFLIASLIFILCIGMIENVVVLVVFGRRPHLRTLSNRFVINLLLTNIMGCLLLLPITLLDGVIVWTGPELDLQVPDFMCGVADGIAALVAAGSILATLLIAIDQYFAVMDPLHYHMKITKPVCVGLIFSSWIIAGTVGGLAGTPAVNKASNFRGLCANSQGTVDHSAWFVLIFGICVFVIPVILLTTIYIRIYSAAHKNSKRTRVSNSAETPQKEEIHLDTHLSHSNSRASSFRNTSSQLVNSLRYRISNASLFLYREEGRAAKISITVLGVALICWLPYFCTMVMHSLNCEVPSFVDSFSILLTLSNSVLSPFLYAYRSRRLQREVKRLFNFPPFDKPKIRRPLVRNRRFLSPQQMTEINDKKSVVISQSANVVHDEKDDDFDDDFYPLSAPVSTNIDDNTKANILSLVCDKRLYWSKWKKTSKLSSLQNFELASVSSGENSRSSFSSATTTGTASTTDTEV